MIGSLIYLMIRTRPDIAWSVSRLSQYMQDPTDEHMTMALNVFHYLRGTTEMKIWYNGNGNSGLKGFCDADWAEDRDNRRSTTGYVFLMADGAVCWTSRMNKTPARSSTESEYVSLSEACSELVWLRHVQTEIGYPPEDPIPLCSDNQGGIFSATNSTHDRRLKHVDLKYHVIRDHVEQKQAKIYYIGTQDQIADALTKPLARPKFEYFRDRMGVQARHM